MLGVESGGVASNALGNIGVIGGSVGEATVTGAVSRWNNSDYLIVGYSGSGTLNVESTGAVTCTFGYIGTDSGSTGVATVTGAGSGL